MAVANAQAPLLFAVATRRFELALLVLGGLLVVGALASPLARRSFLSLTALFVSVGFALGPGALGVLRFDARSAFVSDLAVIALIVILFRDGLDVDGEMPQRQWHLPLRKLALAMPLTAAIVALAARLLTSLSWSELLTLHGLFGEGWAAAGIVAVALLVARPVAVLGALAGTAAGIATRAFMAWFGPKGVATMTFSLLVLSQPIAAGQRIFNLAALVVFCSIIVHGCSDTAGAEWIARRSEPSRSVTAP